MDIANIDKYFPLENYREGQREVIEFTANAFNEGKRIVILECPTGSGKSPIGMTLMNMAQSSYYLTITKILQEQFSKDFGETETSVIEDPNEQVVELKGKNAYPCSFYDRYGKRLVESKIWTNKILDEYISKNPTCEYGHCKTKWNGSKFKGHCRSCFLAKPNNHIETSFVQVPKGSLTVLPSGCKYSACPYYERVFRAINSRKAIMNFSSFLYQTTLTNRFAMRDLLVVDECHNIETELLNFISLTINDLQLVKYGIKLPKLERTIDYAGFFHDYNVMSVLSEVIKSAKRDENLRLATDMERVKHKLEMFMDHATMDTEWVCEHEVKGKQTKYNSVTLRPVFVNEFANEYLFSNASKILMMSATVLDVNVMCRSLGIKKSELATYRMKSRFPVKNRPIYYKPVAKLVGGKKNMHTWIDKVVRGVDEIMDKYKNVRGIIHTHNFAIMDDLLAKCKASSRSRFLDQRQFNSKQDMLNVHAQSYNTVIVAPAMHEGVDLKNELSRFQIICKIPYANCFDDKQLARRVELDRRFYTWLTALKLCQAYGRSVRSEDDYADTYIIDSAYDSFERMANGMLPIWFTEAIIR